MNGNSKTPTPAPDPIRCTEHKAIVGAINGMKETIMEERRQRETAFTVLNTKLETVSEKVGGIEIKMAKLLGGIAVGLALVQVALKFIPGG
jgi:hypothetical protein